MDTKAIINHIRTEGFRKTYQKQKRSRKNGTSGSEKKLKSSHTYLYEVLDKRNAPESYNRFSMIAGIDKEDFDTESDLQDAVDKKLTKVAKSYRDGLKAYYIKDFLPKLYDALKDCPVQDKVIILQPRSKLNSSCKYIYDRLVADGKYKVVFHEFKGSSVSRPTYFHNAVDFIIDLATAKAVISHEQSEILGSIKLRPETKFIQLWHGLPLKKLRKSMAGYPGYKSLKAFEDYPESNYDLVPISSPEWRRVFEEFMGLERDTPVIQSIGISRTDQFFEKDYIEACYSKLYTLVPVAKEKKVILYAPTYRGLEPNRVAPDMLDVSKFAEALKDNYILIIKHHQTLKTWPFIPEEYENTFAYDFRKINGMDINQLLTVADVCISDYSSLVFDYSLFERPIIFFAYDEEEYGDERGFYYTVEDLDAGPVFKTNEEIIDYINNLDERFDRKKIVDFRRRFMSDCDGHSTDRVIEYIDNIGSKEL